MSGKVWTRLGKFAEPWVASLRTEVPARWPRLLRLALLLVMAAVQLRFIHTIRAAGLPEEQQMANVCLVGALFCVHGNPRLTVLGGIVLAPLLSLWFMVSSGNNPALAYLPFATASLAWTIHGLLLRRSVVLRVSGIGWLCDAFTLTVLVKIVVAMLSPSAVNSLWRLLSVPIDFPYSEIQSMNAGLYLLNMLMVFRVVETESARCDCQKILLSCMVAQFVLVSAAALAQALFQWPSFFRNGLHSPFVGVHELGFYVVTHFVFFAGLAFSQHSVRAKVGWGSGASIAFLLLLGSNSKTSLALALVAFGVLGMVRFGRRAVIPTVGLTLTCWLIAFLLSQFTLPIDSATAAAIRSGFLITANPVYWFDSGRSRVSLYGKALSLIAERPLDGVGVGDYRVSHTPKTLQLQSGMPAEQLRDHDAHNLLLNIAAEAGIPSAFLMLVWLGATCLTATRLSKPLLAGWGQASVLAILTGLLANMTNCVLTWPFQGLTFGLLLGLPVAALHSQQADSTSIRQESRWYWLALLPAVLNSILAPWSVSADMRLQQASFGFLRWDWFANERQDISAYPMAYIPIAASAQVGSLRIKPCRGMHRQPPRLTLTVNDAILIQDQEIPEQGVTVAIPEVLSTQSLRLRVATSNPFTSMAWPAELDEAWIWRIELWNTSGVQVDVRKLPLMSELAKPCRALI